MYIPNWVTDRLHEEKNYKIIKMGEMEQERGRITVQKEGAESLRWDWFILLIYKRNGEEQNGDIL